MRASLMRWHRRAGLAAAVLVLLATVTGVLINHADALGLPHRRVSDPLILRWWGIRPPELRVAHAVAGRWLSQWDAQLHLDGEPLRTPPVRQLVGVVALDDGLWAVADRERLLLLTPEGALVDQLALPPGFAAARVGRLGPGSAGPSPAVVVEGADGRQLHTDAQGTALLPHAASPDTRVLWSSAGALPAKLRARSEQASNHGGLSAERLLLDLHSGRWLGPWGVWLMDAAAVLLLVLAATGAWSVWRGAASAQRERSP